MKGIFSIPLPLPVSVPALKNAINALHGDDLGYSLMDDTAKVTDSIRAQITASEETIDVLKAGPVIVETEDGPVDVLLTWISDVGETVK